MVGELKRELIWRQVLRGEQFFDLVVADVEIQRAAFVAEPVGIHYVPRRAENRQHLAEIGEGDRKSVV